MKKEIKEDDLTQEERELLFDKYYPELEEALKKRRHKWKLNSLSYIGYEDICQILTVHIYSKLHLFDTDKPFINWCNKTITHQLQNQVRNHYGNLAPPCNRCPDNQGDNRCGFTPNHIKCDLCPAFKKWSKAKKNGYYLKLASSLDHPDYIETKANTREDYDFVFEEKKLMAVLHSSLDEVSLVILDCAIIKGEEEKKVAESLKISVNELKKRKVAIIELAKQTVKDDRI